MTRRFPVVRYAWALPATLLGLLVALPVLGSGGSARPVAGALEVSGGTLPRWIGRLPTRFRFGAITLGHVVIGADRRTLDCVRAHERVHVRQYERWGALFIPLYLASSLWQLVRGGDPYRDNRFERQARAGSAQGAGGLGR